MQLRPMRVCAPYNASLDVRERQASAAPALDELVEDLLVAVLQRSDKPVVVAIELTASG